MQNLPISRAISQASKLGGRRIPSYESRRLQGPVLFSPPPEMHSFPPAVHCGVERRFGRVECWCWSMSIANHARRAYYYVQSASKPSVLEAQTGPRCRHSSGPFETASIPFMQFQPQASRSIERAFPRSERQPESRTSLATGDADGYRLESFAICSSRSSCSSSSSSNNTPKLVCLKHWHSRKPQVSQQSRDPRFSQSHNASDQHVLQEMHPALHNGTHTLPRMDMACGVPRDPRRRKDAQDSRTLHYYYTLEVKGCPAALDQ